MLETELRVLYSDLQAARRDGCYALLPTRLHLLILPLPVGLWVQHYSNHHKLLGEGLFVEMGLCFSLDETVSSEVQRNCSAVAQGPAPHHHLPPEVRGSVVSYSSHADGVTAHCDFNFCFSND